MRNFTKKFLKLLGYVHNYGGRDRTFKFKWGEVAFLTKALDLKWRGHEYGRDAQFSFSLYFFSVFINTPNWGGIPDTLEGSNHYGFYVYPTLVNIESIAILWGKHCKFIDAPWTYKYVRTDYLNSKREIIFSLSSFDNSKIEEHFQKYKETYNYTNTTDKGEVQTSEATIVPECRVYRMRWLPWIKKEIYTIDIKFNKEIGKGVNTWKGGTIGCSYEMLPWETPYQTLQRMEMERHL